jgi:hypothetical protein
MVQKAAGILVRARGALKFKTDVITYTIQGDPRLANENGWFPLKG